MVSHPEDTDIGFIVLAPHDWNDRWLGRAQVVSRIAKRFHVVWMGPPHEWRGIPRRLRAGPSLSQPVAGLPMLHAYRAEAWLPRLYRPCALASYLLERRLRRARSLLASKGCARIVLSIWSPQYADVLPMVEHDLSIYHINDEYSFSPVEVPISDDERRLMAGADEVFIHSPAILERKGKLCRSAALTPNGVDFYAFANARPIPDDLAAIPAPRIGYTGFLKMQLDWELLFSVASGNPRWSFVFAGSALDQPGLVDALETIRALPNVHFLGSKSTVELSAYPQHFDVCMLPYRVNDYTKYLDPLKLGEYMASGRPAVGTPILPLRAVQHLIFLAASADEWTQSIAAAMGSEPNSLSERAKRQEWARARTWDSTVDIILRRVERHLSPRLRGDALGLPSPGSPGSYELA